MEDDVIEEQSLKTVDKIVINSNLFDEKVESSDSDSDSSVSSLQ